MFTYVMLSPECEFREEKAIQEKLQQKTEWSTYHKGTRMRVTPFTRPNFNAALQQVSGLSLPMVLS